MRNVFLSLLLATTMATPALALQQSSEDREAARAERKAERAQAKQERSEARQERQEARPQRVQSPQRAEQSERGQRVERSERGQRVERTQRVQSPARAERTERTLRRQTVEPSRQTVQQRQVQRDSVREQRREDRAASRDRWINSAEQTRRRVSVPIDARPDRPAPPPVAVDSHRRAPSWRTDWRHDRRYDWRNHRHRHRSLFRLGFYLDPFGWGYQRWGVGWRLWPSYYSSSYWLNDPWQYRLPYAPWPYKWVRYYDDALLVNTYTGQVVDVIYEFFW